MDKEPAFGVPEEMNLKPKVVRSGLIVPHRMLEAAGENTESVPAASANALKPGLVTYPERLFSDVELTGEPIELRETRPARRRNDIDVALNGNINDPDDLLVPGEKFVECRKVLIDRA